MELADFLTKEQVVTDLKASDRWEAIEELIDLLVDSGQIKSDHREAIVSIVKKRETSMSTGIGFGIGIPHASSDLIDNVTGAFGRSKDGVNFDALANQPVKLGEVLALLCRHLVDCMSPSAMPQHGPLTGIDSDGAVFAGMIDPDHPLDQFILGWIAWESVFGGEIWIRCVVVHVFVFPGIRAAAYRLLAANTAEVRTL